MFSRLFQVLSNNSISKIVLVPYDELVCMQKALVPLHVFSAHLCSEFRPALWCICKQALLTSPLPFQLNTDSVSSCPCPRVHLYKALSHRWVTSIDALWSPAEWEINCQTMHSSHPLRFSLCQMVSRHYRMSGCIIYRTLWPPPPPSSFHSPHAGCTPWWIGSIKRQDFYHHFIFPLFILLRKRGDM